MILMQFKVSLNIFFYFFNILHPAVKVLYINNIKDNHS
jgi:hypothetical protein